MFTARLLFCLGVLCLVAGPAQTGFAGSAETGKELTKRHCSGCHAVGETGDSPLPEAPPFREIAKRYPAENLAESFAEGITTGHDEMPEFVFSTEEVGQLVDYFASLARSE